MADVSISTPTSVGYSFHEARKYFLRLQNAYGGSYQQLEAYKKYDEGFQIYWKALLGKDEKLKELFDILYKKIKENPECESYAVFRKNHSSDPLQLWITRNLPDVNSTDYFRKARLYSQRLGLSSSSSGDWNMTINI